MKKNLAIILAVASVLVIVSLVGVVYAQNVTAPVTQRNSEASICVNDENGYCGDNTNANASCTSNQYGQAQQNCFGFGYQSGNQNQWNYGDNCGGCGSVFQRGCR